MRKTQLLDEGRYLCSESTMYRPLRANAEVLERRRLVRHNEHEKPELLATGPPPVLSWDITKVCGPEKAIDGGMFAPQTINRSIRTSPLRPACHLRMLLRAMLVATTYLLARALFPQGQAAPPGKVCRSGCLQLT
jgi:hypothetical protein